MVCRQARHGSHALSRVVATNARVLHIQKRHKFHEGTRHKSSRHRIDTSVSGRIGITIGRSYIHSSILGRLGGCVTDNNRAVAYTGGSVGEGIDKCRNVRYVGGFAGMLSTRGDGEESDSKAGTGVNTRRSNVGSSNVGGDRRGQETTGALGRQQV